MKGFLCAAFAASTIAALLFLACATSGFPGATGEAVVETAPAPVLTEPEEVLFAEFERPDVYFPWVNPLQTPADFIPTEPNFSEEKAEVPPPLAASQAVLPAIPKETETALKAPAISEKTPEALPLQAAAEEARQEPVKEEKPSSTREAPAPPKTVRPAAAKPAKLVLAAQNPAENAAAASQARPARPALFEPRDRDQSPVSRTIRAVENQIVEIPFRGSGWVYLGERNSKRGASYDSRRLDGEGQTFVFRAEEPGTYYLNFNKQDFVNDYNIGDTVELVVGPKDSGNPAASPSQKAQADIWPSAQAAPAGVAPTQPAARAQTEPPAQDQAISPEGGGGEDYLSLARIDFKDGKFQQALGALSSYLDGGSEPTDEVWWLYAQALESNSPARDIKASLNAYRRITDGFPQSAYYDDAKSRIAYLNKFYFNIR